MDEEIRDVCERILSEIRQPFRLSEDLFVEMTASIGVSVYPRDGQDEKELLSRADQAMYRIKKVTKTITRLQSLFLKRRRSLKRKYHTQQRPA